MPHSSPSALDTALLGKRILITRPAEAQNPEGTNDALSTQLEAWGAQVVSLPLVEIQPLPFRWEPAQRYDWLFFTSKNAVRSFFRQVDLSAAFQSGLATRIAVVGPATAQCVQALGYPVDFVSPEYHAESAATAFCHAYPAMGLQILWPCGNLANPTLHDILQAAGAIVSPLLVYQTALKTRLSPTDRELCQSPLDMLVFTSPSAVSAWWGLNPDATATSAIPVACLGPKTTQAAVRHLGRVAVQAEPHTLEALAASILKYFTEGN